MYVDRLCGTCLLHTNLPNACAYLDRVVGPEFGFTQLDLLVILVAFFTFGGGVVVLTLGADVTLVASCWLLSNSSILGSGAASITLGTGTDSWKVTLFRFSSGQLLRILSIFCNTLISSFPRVFIQ
jgi:hypothetical protein